MFRTAVFYAVNYTEIHARENKIIWKLKKKSLKLFSKLQQKWTQTSVKILDCLKILLVVIFKGI